MASVIESQVDILIEVMDDNVDSISPAFLENKALMVSFLGSLADYPVIAAKFVLKVPTPAVVSLCLEDILTEELLSTLFLLPTFSFSKMLDILREMPFDSRKFILNELKEEKFSQYADLEKKIDVRYGMIEGVFFQEVSTSVNVYDKLKESLSNSAASLDKCKQYLFTAYRDVPSYHGFLTLNLPAYEPLIKKSTVVASKEEFSTIIKLSYLLTLDSDLLDRYKNQVADLKKRILDTLSGYSNAQAIVVILEQLSESMIHLLLVDISLAAEDADIKIKSKFLFVKSVIAKAIQTGFAKKAKKVVRRNQLAYTVTEGESK